MTKNGHFQIFHKNIFFDSKDYRLRAKVTKFQCEVVKKNAIFGHFGPTWPILAKKVNFLIFLENIKRHFFTLPQTSINAKYQENPTCSFIEKRGRERERDET